MWLHFRRAAVVVLLPLALVLVSSMDSAPSGGGSAYAQPPGCEPETSI